MTRSISLDEKQQFYYEVINIAGAFANTNMQFAIATFGSTIYQDLVFRGYNEFYNYVYDLMANLPNPNGDRTMVTP